LGDFTLLFLVEGSARVGGGVPIFSRAAAFTADAALNGFGLRGFDGTLYPQTIATRILTAGATWQPGLHDAQESRLKRANPASPTVALQVRKATAGESGAEDGNQYEYPSGWATAPTSMVVST
jgi:hypothetical protein